MIPLLTDRGISQAKSVGKGLEDIEFTAVYTSESQRVIDTANYAVGHRNLPTNTDPRLKEMNFGALESLLASEISELYGDILEKLFALNDMNMAPPEGESYTQLYTRAISIIKEMIENHQNEGGNILVFSHGITIGYYLMQLTQMNKFPHHDNCSVSVVKYKNNQFEVETIASTDFRDHFQ
ncbi:MAG: histidine phosphatase family protein [Bacillota bacterium]